ncbi:hypothetical protein BDZ91DRAFT_798034 [Kalaharituber pfeilii]|nr:hypothetical protein BDZ91DRAFT_798034 [Kalaharituber pfeilii]
MNPRSGRLLRPSSSPNTNATASNATASNAPASNATASNVPSNNAPSSNAAARNAPARVAKGQSRSGVRKSAVRRGRTKQSSLISSKSNTTARGPTADSQEQSTVNEEQLQPPIPFSNPETHSSNCAHEPKPGIGPPIIYLSGNLHAGNLEAFKKLYTRNGESSNSLKHLQLDRISSGPEPAERDETTTFMRALSVVNWLHNLQSENLLDPFEASSRQDLSSNGLPSLENWQGNSVYTIYTVRSPTMPTGTWQKASGTARARRLQMSRSRPSILFKYGAIAAEDPQPLPLVTLLDSLNLFTNMDSKSSISEPFKEYMKRMKNHNEGSDELPSHSTEADVRSTENDKNKQPSEDILKACWQRAQNLATEARNYLEDMEEEGEWRSLVSTLLKDNLLREVVSTFPVINNIGTKSITSSKLNSELLPLHNGKPIIGSRVDLQLIMQRGHPMYKRFTSPLDPFGSTDDTFHLSPLIEQACHHPSLLLIECKASLGNIMEAENQLAIAAASWLRAIDHQIFDGRGIGRRISGHGISVDDKVEASLMDICLMVITVKVAMGVWEWGVAYMDGSGSIVIRNRVGNTSIGDMSRPEGVCNIAAWVAAAHSWLETKWIPAIVDAIDYRNQRRSSAAPK